MVDLVLCVQDLFSWLCNCQSNRWLNRLSRPRGLTQASCDVIDALWHHCCRARPSGLIRASLMFLDRHVLKPHAHLAQIGACIWCFPQKCQKQKRDVLKQFLKLATVLPERSCFVLSGLQSLGRFCGRVVDDERSQRCFSRGSRGGRESSGWQVHEWALRSPRNPTGIPQLTQCLVQHRFSTCLNPLPLRFYRRNRRHRKGTFLSSQHGSTNCIGH